MKKRILLIAIITIIVSILLSSGTMALFLRTNSFSGTVNAKEFYFESDLLDTTNPNYELNAGTKSISFTVMNYEDELRYSKTDINVVVEISNGSLDEFNTVLIKETTLEKENLSKATFTIYNLEDGQEYKIVVKGTSGYEKELKATFTVRNKENLIYKYIDNSDPNFLYITIWSTFQTGNVKVSYNNENMVPDKTWPLSKDIALNATTFNVVVEENSSYVFRFIKKSEFSQTDLSSISITLDEVELLKKAPQ